MKCPVCRAENDQGPQCRRCRADLALLYQLPGHRRQVREDVIASLKVGQLDSALKWAAYMHSLARDDESHKLLAVVHLLKRDFRQAFLSYRQVSSSARNEIPVPVAAS